MKIYLAGKISENDWRCSLVSQPGAGDWRETVALPILDKYRQAMGDICTGPFYVECDHACTHRPGRVHGVTGDCSYSDFTEAEVVAKSMQGIRDADLVFCFAEPDHGTGSGTDFATAHGTHAELGYAKAAHKPIVIVRHPALDPTLAWFPLALADLTLYGDDPIAELMKLRVVASSVSRGARVDLRKELAERRKREEAREAKLHRAADND